MWSFTVSRRGLITSGLLVAFSAGMVCVAGCGEREARIAPSDKKKEDMQKDIDNPYGAEIKDTIKKGKSARGPR
ncbi:hypothetical protein [Paludisphaera mucosa]|uniref:Uncharacterized protein n=1 Tax=Paludisphaera mucosa TaxID=3030827 RepID=A0ABT6FH95_9BACT|nr:hypothetical protein [Paludisphaera mucosa]MDG3006884.1 hypothetical protein [Paludisphaera mucosa]